MKLTARLVVVIFLLSFITFFVIYSVIQEDVIYLVIHEDDQNICDCSPILQKTSDNKFADKDAFKETTCGETSFRRGFGQKVIGFSFYEHDSIRLEERRLNKSFDFPPYFRGIEENLDLVPILYPGWIVRLYHDLQQEDPLCETICSYQNKYNYFDLCQVHHLPSVLVRG